MQLCDWTLPTGEENLACDEALLEQCEASDHELLRFWEPQHHFVVVGYANTIDTEVNVPFCRDHRMPILRRITGGGTVLQGAGCLNYSLILRIDASGPLSTITGTNAFILDRHCKALSHLLAQPVSHEGQTDLAIRGVKFSGNAQRRRRGFLLFHGTFLLQFDLALIQQALLHPSRQPEYRRNRSHGEFLTNLTVPAERVKNALATAWAADPQPIRVALQRIEQLVGERYGRAEWNMKF